MNRQVFWSPAFTRAAERLLKRCPEIRGRFNAALRALEEDAFEPGLHSHKLRGKLSGTWACNVTHDIRIVFELAEAEGREVIVLVSVGSHDQVY